MAGPISGLTQIPSNFDFTDFLIDNNQGANCRNNGPLPSQVMEMKFRFTCGPAHLSYNDPIIYPGQEGAAHLHHFFGNETVDHNSTYTSLRGAGNGTCAGGPINRTGYWFPAMIKPAGPGFPVPKVVIPNLIEMYYMSVPNDLDPYTRPMPNHTYQTEGLQGFPNGMQMVFGWGHAHPIPPPHGVWGRNTQGGGPDPISGLKSGTLDQLYHNWSAESWEDLEGRPYHDDILARIVSPSCWDGLSLRGTNGRDHLRAQIQDQTTGVYCCPPTHRFRIPALTVIIWWSNNGPDDWRHWYLSVDRHQGHNLRGGHGFHADWFGAWDEMIQASWEQVHLALGPGTTGGTKGAHTAADLAGRDSSGGVLCRDDFDTVPYVFPGPAPYPGAPGYTGDLQLKSPGVHLPNRVPNGSHLYLPEEYRYADIPEVPGQNRLRLNLSAAA